MYQYDGIGNREKTVNGLVNDLPGTNNWTANALNQYTKANGVTLPTTPTPAPYDFDGNLRFDGGVNKDSENREYVWDGENRLIEIKNNSGSIQKNYYDAGNRKIATTANSVTTYYIYDGFNRIAEYTGTTLEKSYLWGMDLSGTMQGAGGVGGLLAVSEHTVVAQSPVVTTFYPTYDGNGNICEYLDDTGTSKAHYEYDAFGNVTFSSGDKAADFAYRFSTKPFDFITGWYYYLYRYYDPLTGRWPSRDPIEERGGVNLYGFVGNDGLNKIDILGLFSQDGHLQFQQLVARINKLVQAGKTSQCAAFSFLFSELLAANTAARLNRGLGDAMHYFMDASERSGSDFINVLPEFTENSPWTNQWQPPAWLNDHFETTCDGYRQEVGDEDTTGRHAHFISHMIIGANTGFLRKKLGKELGNEDTESSKTDLKVNEAGRELGAAITKGEVNKMQNGYNNPWNSSDKINQYVFKNLCNETAPCCKNKSGILTREKVVELERQ